MGASTSRMILLLFPLFDGWMHAAVSTEPHKGCLADKSINYVLPNKSNDHKQNTKRERRGCIYGENRV